MKLLELKSTVEIKLDKSLQCRSRHACKGGTVSDVLENVPSVSVDVRNVEFKR
jgi:hypothetical protein